MIKLFFNKYRKVLVLLFSFALLYSLISLTNHYNFRTYALDLGAYTNALYDYSHFHLNDSTVFKETGENLLADHFDLYLILFSPFVFLFGTYTLLVMQILFVLFGGVGIYLYLKASDKPEFIALAATLFFFLFFGTFSALAFDYHSNVVAASLLPWLFYTLKKEKWLATSLVILFIIVAKENTSLWLAFIFIGFSARHWKEKPKRNFMLASSVVCFVFFILVTTAVMPALSNNGTYPHFHYSVLGSNFGEAFYHLIRHPLESLEVLFTNHTAEPNSDYVKTEFHTLILLCGLPLLLRKPWFLLMLIPIYFQKMFHDNPSMWGVFGHYNIEFAPILAIGVFLCVSDIKNSRMLKISCIAVLALELACTIRTFDSTVQFTNKACLRFYQQCHYERDYNVAAVHKHLSEIPSEAIVSAQSPFLPHLALRESIYQFPIIRDAEYVVFSNREEMYPLKENEFQNLTDSLLHSDIWTPFIHTKELVILKRNSN